MSGIDVTRGWTGYAMTGRSAERFGHFARLMVTTSRTYRTLLMQTGRRISCDFSRHMEFEADRREAAVVGTEMFVNISRRLRELNAATTNRAFMRGTTLNMLSSATEVYRLILRSLTAQ
jgi:hypothetical protein